MKKGVTIVLAVIGSLLILPVVAVASLTDLGALASPGVKLYTGTASTNNTYIFGYCTFWAAQRRIEINKSIPNNWGDAHSWDTGAKAAGYLVDHNPEVGAIMQTDTGKLGHVAFVEKVNPDGSWEISEMNAKGWNILSSRTFTAEQAKNYSFIH